MNAEDVRKVREEHQVGMAQARAIIRHRERLTRLQNMLPYARGVLRDLIALMIEEEQGE